MSFYHLPASQGTCVFCRESEKVISWPASDGALGVCDVCSYALRHTWQKQRGELVSASTPVLVRTYALVPRLPEGRIEEDVSAYEFLVLKGDSPSLPYTEWSKSDEDFCVRLGQTLGVVTWPETVRSCYLGYASSADFSEVKLAWAWGKALPAPSSMTFVSFAELLAAPTPDAGFYLGLKAAFESLLWRREVAPEGNKLCVFMREPAMRYLRSLDPVPGAEPDDESMVEVCHQAMSADELEVAEILEEARERRLEDADAEESPKTVAEKVSDKVDDGEGAAEVESGYARARGKIVGPGDK